MEGILILLLPFAKEFLEACMKRWEERRGFDTIKGLRKPRRREKAAIWLMVWRNRRKLGLKEQGFTVREVAEYSFNRLCVASDDQILMLASGDTTELAESMLAEVKATAS